MLMKLEQKQNKKLPEKKVNYNRNNTDGRLKESDIAF